MKASKCRRVLIISDVHANVVALDAVLDDAGDQFDAVWCLGDMVGYGPDPNQCVDRVRKLPGMVCLLGNHDKAALGDVDLRNFNPDACEALLWTQRELSSTSRSFLERLPSSTLQQDVTLAHGSPRDPVWEYTTDVHVALQNFSHFSTPLCLVGHSHVPFVFRWGDSECSGHMPSHGQRIVLRNGRYILNPGSVGQPRDRNPMASYAFLDFSADTWELYRVHYDVVETQRRMEYHSLPERLVGRLTLGM